MARFSVGVLVGSARKGSINQKLADAAVALGAPDVEFSTLKIADLPMFNQDLEEAPPASVERFRQELRASDGLLFVTPEYNRSTTPLLLNALSWGSRPYGHNSFAGKPGAIIGTSAGIIRSAAAQAHLRDILGVLDVRLIGQPEAYIQFSDGLIGEDGTITDDAVRGLLEKKLAGFAEWVALVSGGRSAAKAA